MHIFPKTQIEDDKMAKDINLILKIKIQDSVKRI